MSSLSFLGRGFIRNILTVSTGALLAACLLAPSLVISPALAADKVGMAAAVKPEATSQPPGGDISIRRAEGSNLSLRPCQAVEGNQY